MSSRPVFFLPFSRLPPPYHSFSSPSLSKTTNGGHTNKHPSSEKLYCLPLLVHESSFGSTPLQFTIGLLLLLCITDRTALFRRLAQENEAYYLQPVQHAPRPPSAMGCRSLLNPQPFPKRLRILAPTNVERFPKEPHERAGVQHSSHTA